MNEPPKAPRLLAIAFQVDTRSARERDHDSIEMLADILETAGTRSPLTRELWSDLLRRYLKDQYPRHAPAAARNEWIARHFWARQAAFEETDVQSATEVATAWNRAGHQLEIETIRTGAARRAERAVGRLFVASQLKRLRREYQRGEILAATIEGCVQVAHQLAGSASNVGFVARLTRILPESNT